MQRHSLNFNVISSVELDPGSFLPHVLCSELMSEDKPGFKPGSNAASFPQEMEKEIKSVFRGGNQDEVLSEAFRLTITRKDIQTLNNLNWLNDEVRSCSRPSGFFKLL